MKTTMTAQQLGVSQRALDLCLDADLIDLHVDTFIPVRLWGYDVMQHHGRGPLNGYYFGHLDLPRMEEQGVTGAMWSLTTNPFRPARQRFAVLQKNRARYEAMVAASGGRMVITSTPDAYAQARAAGLHRE